jgi:hypothetical protein
MVGKNYLAKDFNYRIRETTEQKSIFRDFIIFVVLKAHGIMGKKKRQPPHVERLPRQERGGD